MQLVRVDPEQFKFFYDRYHDRIFKYLYWKTGDQDLATELVGETFQQAWRKLDNFTWQGYSFGAWLFQIARSRVGRFHRSQKRHREVEFDPDRHDAGVDDLDELERGRQQDETLLRVCLSRLGPMRQDVFILHYWVGMTTAQTAITLKIPAGTVKTHLRRGRIQLRRWLLESPNEEGLSERGRQAVQEQARRESELRLIDKRRDRE